MSDLELKLHCDCYDPYEFLWISLDLRPPWTGKKNLPELWMCGQFYNGTPWQRIKHAIKYIVRGEYRERLDFVFFGKENFLLLRDFADKAIDMIEKNAGVGNT